MRILWQRHDVPGMEWCETRAEDTGTDVEGVALAAADGRPRRYEYLVRTDLEGRTRRVVVHEGTRRLELEADGRGTWRRDGAVVLSDPAALDVDLGFSPATNSLPLWRLPAGASHEVVVALVDDRDLSVAARRQAYDPLDGTRWRFTAGDFAAELELGPGGLLTRYGELWTAVALQG